MHQALPHTPFCSNLFIAKRQFEDIEQFDLPSEQQLLTRSRIDGNTVTTDFGIWPINYTSVSVYRPGLGCGQLAGGNLADLEGPASIERVLPERQPRHFGMASAEYPQASIPNGSTTCWIAHSAIRLRAMKIEKNTRAVVIFYRDQLIAERYAQGFDATTPQNSWSMTKSATQRADGHVGRATRASLLICLLCFKPFVHH